MRLILVWVLMTMLISNVSYATTRESFYGNWIVKARLDTRAIYALSEKEAKKFIGKQAAFSATEAVFDGETCNAPRYQEELIDKDTFLTANRIPLTDLGIESQSVLVIRIMDGNTDKFWDGPIDTLYVKDHNTLIIHYEGVYFELARKK